MKKLFTEKRCYWICMISGVIVTYSGYQRTFHGGDWGFMEKFHPQVLAMPFPVRVAVLVLFIALYLPIVYRACQYDLKKTKKKSQ